MESTSVHPLVLAAIRNTKGETKQIAKRYGVSAELVRDLRRGTTKRYTRDQIREVYSSREKSSVISRRLDMPDSMVSRIRSGKIHRHITFGLVAPERKHHRSKEEIAAERNRRRRAKLELEQARRRTRNAILQSRKSHSQTAREVGCSIALVYIVRAAHGWTPPKRKPRLKFTPKRPPTPKYDYPRRPVGRPRIRPVKVPRVQKVKPVRVALPEGRPKSPRPTNLQPVQTLWRRRLGLTPGIDWNQIVEAHRNSKLGSEPPVRYRPSYGLVTIKMYRIPVGSQKSCSLDGVSNAPR